MPESIIQYISEYGYLAIFLLIMFQEVGIPTPIPNELLMLFTGYLVYAHVLHPYIAVLVGVADLLAGTILYSVFYFFGNVILKKEHRWLPISQERITKLTKKFNERGTKSIFIARLSPFIRGYVAVICGLSHYKPRIFIILLAVASALWSSFYLTVGYFLGPYWDSVQAHMDHIEYFLLAIPIIFLLVIIVRVIINVVNKRTSKDTN